MMGFLRKRISLCGNGYRDGVVALGLCAAFFSFQPLMAQTATISLEVDGSNSVDYGAVAGGFTLDIVVSSTDAAGMSSFDIVLDGDSQFEIGAPDIDTSFGLRRVLNYNLGNNWGQDTAAGAIEWVAQPLPMSGLSTGTIGTTNLDALGLATNGLAAFVQIMVSAPPGVYIIGGTDAFVGDSTGTQQLTPTIIPLTILPEPVSIMLLVGGVMLLCRRSVSR